MIIAIWIVTLLLLGPVDPGRLGPGAAAGGTDGLDRRRSAPGWRCPLAAGWTPGSPTGWMMAHAALDACCRRAGLAGRRGAGAGVGAWGAGALLLVLGGGAAVAAGGADPRSTPRAAPAAGRRRRPEALQPRRANTASSSRHPACLQRWRREAGLEAVGGQLPRMLRRQLRQGGKGLDEVLVDITAEIGGVVAVDGHAQAGVQQRGQVVRGQRPEDAQLDVRQRAHRQRHALARQPLHQRRALGAAHAVVDALAPSARRARFRCRPAGLPRRRGPPRAGPVRGSARTHAQTSPAGGRARCCPGPRR
jgi:hypothetical protein